MAICKTDAIVLRTYRHGETSKIAILYSKAFGKAKVMAKGARNPKSRFGAALEPMTEVAVVFYRREGREVHTLSQGDLIAPFSSLRSSLEKLGYASAIVELTDHLAIYEEPNTALYHLLQACLTGIERAPQELAEKFLWHFQLRIADLCGYRPQFARCVHCGRAVSGERPRFDLAGGGMVCEACLRGPLSGREDVAVRGSRYVDLHRESAAFLHKLQKTMPDEVERVVTQARFREEIRDVLSAFLEHHTEDRRRLRSLDFLAKVSESPSG